MMRCATRLAVAALVLVIGAGLGAQGSRRRGVPDDEEIEGLVRLRWTRPEALAAELPLLLRSDRAVTLAVEIEDGVEARFERLTHDPESDVFEWRLVSGEGTLRPRSDGVRCRLAPTATSEEIVVAVELQRTYTARRLGFRSVQRTATASITARVVAPLSAGHIDAEGRIEGYEIGLYPDPRDEVSLAALGNCDWVRLHPEAYESPRWFHPITDVSRAWPISPHLRLGDFILDHPWFSLGMPQWVAIHPLLVSKLEELAAMMHADGHEFDHWTLIYGFRPPVYNLGRIARDAEETLKSPFSQHMYGRAADIIIDTDGDLRLDDLNRDGVIDVHDAAVIMHHINVLDRHLRATGDPRVGGAGLYDHHDFFERPVQSPYAHTDVRGFCRDDEGQTLIRWPDRWPDTGEWIRWGDI